MKLIMELTVDEAKRLFAPVREYDYPVAATAPVEYMGPLPSNALDFALVDLMRAGNKISAIKLYRTVYGKGLKESKDHCDSLQNRS